MPALTRLDELLLNGLCRTGQRLRRRASRLDLCLGSTGPYTRARVFPLSRAHYILELVVGWVAIRAEHGRMLLNQLQHGVVVPYKVTALEPRRSAR